MSKDKIIETFNQWAEKGMADELESGHGDVVRQVVAKLGIAAGDKILDLGCGNGWATRLLAQTEAGVQAIGVDCSPQMIARADELHSFTIRSRYDLGEFENLEFSDGEFSKIFSMEALYYAADLPAALKEALRVLKPGGTADVIVDYYTDNPGAATWADVLDLPLHSLSAAEWRAAFEGAGFTNITIERVIDSRGPGDEAAFEPSEWYPDWRSKVAAHDAGSLWIHAEKPA